MDKPTNHPAPAPATNPNPLDDYISTAGPPPAYPPGEQQGHNQQPYESHEMPKYGGPPPDPNYSGAGYYGQQQQQPPPPPPPQQSFAPYGTPLPALGPHPAPIECPECHSRGVTAVEYKSGGFTHSLAAIVCLVSCLGCIPYFFSSLKDARHKCCKCGIPLATYHRSGRTEVHWHNAYNG